MKHATSRELYQYWDRVRRGEPAPRRSDIEPSDIRRILAETFILEVVDRDHYTVRLAGTRICAALGRELKNTNFLDLFTTEDRQAVATLATAVTDDAAAAVVTLAAATGRERPVSCEMMLLPLRHTGTACDRILGSFAAFERPYWFGSEPLVRHSVVSLRLVWPDEKPHFMRRSSDGRNESVPPPAIVSSAPIPFPVENRRRRGHLTVLDGGKA